MAAINEFRIILFGYPTSFIFISWLSNVIYFYICRSSVITRYFFCICRSSVITRYFFYICRSSVITRYIFLYLPVVGDYQIFFLYLSVVGDYQIVRNASLWGCGESRFNLFCVLSSLTHPLILRHRLSHYQTCSDLKVSVFFWCCWVGHRWARENLSKWIKWVLSMGPVRIHYSSHHFATQASHFVDRSGWQAKMASIEFWIQWRNAHSPIVRFVSRQYTKEKRFVLPNMALEF